MPDIKFNFSGCIKTEIETARDKNGREIDVSDMSAEEFIEKHKKGELTFSFHAAYENSYKQDLDITDIEEC
jgi:hypothetical protein